MVMKNCVVCGIEFDAKSTAKTCSKVCFVTRKKETNRKWREANRERLQEYGRNYSCLKREVTPEKGREANRKWREANREELRTYQREYDRKRREANPEKYNENARKIREANLEKYREYDRKWREANPEKYREAKRSNCNKANYRKNVTRILYEET